MSLSERAVCCLAIAVASMTACAADVDGTSPNEFIRVALEGMSLSRVDVRLPLRDDVTASYRVSGSACSLATEIASAGAGAIWTQTYSVEATFARVGSAQAVVIVSGVDLCRDSVRAVCSLTGTCAFDVVSAAVRDGIVDAHLTSPCTLRSLDGSYVATLTRYDIRGPHRATTQEGSGVSAVFTSRCP